MRVLVAVDGSFPSMYAVQRLAERHWADAAAVRVRVLHVVPIPVVPVQDAFGLGLVGVPPEPSPELRQHAEQLVHRAAEVLRGQGLRVEPVVRQGDPRDTIVDEAQRWGADLVVLGTHGHTGLKRLLLGSVAAYVATHAPCSVEIARERPLTVPVEG